MHEALCRSSGTTLDILHAERRAADHSANIGSKQPDRVYPLVKNQEYDRVYDWEDRAD